MVAALVAMFLPIETMGIDLPEDTDDMQATKYKHKSSFLGAGKGGPERAPSAGVPSGPAQGGRGDATSFNPFATAQDLASGRVGQYQDQYGLDGTVEQ